MDDVFGRMLELSRKGYFCAQILMQLALDAEGKDCPELIRAMGGLNAGIGFSGGPCGALTGGACFLAYFSEGLDGREGDPSNQLRRCPALVQEVYGKCVELLEARGLC